MVFTSAKAIYMLCLRVFISFVFNDKVLFGFANLNY